MKEFQPLMPSSAPPQTPGRISLSDLIVNPEDLLNQLPSATPNEQVTWKHVPGLLNTPSSSVRTTQRGTKRSVSSSPRSSQLQPSKHFKHDAGVLDANGMGRPVQRSPTRGSPTHDDPAAVLWMNYAGKIGKEPALPPLLPFDLSPQSRDAGKKDPFRRTASCGIEWPTSDAKRRRLGHHDPHSTTKQIFASKRKEILKPELPQRSRVSILLDSVQKNFTARQREVDEPSSSSPLPERVPPDVAVEEPRGIADHRSPSPKKRQSGSPLKQVSPQKVDKLSDFEDLDFDEDDLEDIEYALTQGQAQLKVQTTSQPLPEVKQDEPPIIPRHSQVPLLKPPASVLQPKAATTPRQHAEVQLNMTDFDEFNDEDDDDVFNDELQKLAEQVDSQTVTAQIQPILNNVAQSRTIATNDGTFDEDFDDRLWDEIGDKAPDIMSFTKQVRDK